MAEVEPHAGLELKEDHRFQRASWTAQRVGCWLMGLGVVAALLGAFGGGPLSSATAGDKDSSFWVEYERLGRLSAPHVMKLHVGSGVARDGKVQLWLGRQFLEAAESPIFTPEPARSLLDHDRAIYEFDVADPGREFAVAFRYKPSSPGRSRAAAGVLGRAAVEFGTFTYP